ncbi:MAG: hypothetical protein GDA39_04475 [Hyphomonadaceae bacterium]|nr:hypothetical protein [Hyphomonadaceae bacterium]MBC6412185.1 hypothetical protein [Hyphomonadaceae bacterium]
MPETPSPISKVPKMLTGEGLYNQSGMGQMGFDLGVWDETITFSVIFMLSENVLLPAGFRDAGEL